MEQLPADLPVLVGRQFVQALSTPLVAVVPSPTAAATDIRQGLHLDAVAAVSSPSMTTGLIKAISPAWHVNISVAVSPPTTGESHRIGFTTRGQTVLPPPARVRAHAHAEFLILETPGVERDFQFDAHFGRHLWGYVLDAESIARIDGEWLSKYIPVPSEEPGLDRFYRGGHRHYITPDEAAELTVAGFGDYIRTEVRK